MVILFNRYSKNYVLVSILLLNSIKLFGQLHVGMKYQGGIIAYLNDDSISGLVLQENDVSLNSMDWWTAAKTCENLRDSGFADWRLPTLSEWERISFEVRQEGVFDTEWGRNYWTQAESEELVVWGGVAEIDDEFVDLFQWPVSRWSLHKSATEAPLNSDGKVFFYPGSIEEYHAEYKRISVRCLREF